MTVQYFSYDNVNSFDGRVSKPKTKGKALPDVHSVEQILHLSVTGRFV